MGERRLGVGIVGAGFAAGIHARGWHELAGEGVEVVAVAARRTERAETFAGEHGIATFLGDVDALIARPEVDVVDICVPNVLHHQYVVAAARAGKHVICEKPLTGYFGSGDSPKGVGLHEALRSADEMIDAAAEAGVMLCYAENWVYMPAVQKARRLVEASRGALLEIRGEESHSGSHAAYAKTWQQSGGGSLLRLGSHPIGAALYLKRCEGLCRDGRPIQPVAVTAEAANLAGLPSFTAGGGRWLVSDWLDVENWSTAIVTFDDGSRGVFHASDVALGGMRDSLDLIMSNGRVTCDLTHSGHIRAYAPAPDVFGGEYIQEKLETKAGWSFPSVGEEWMLGYPQELRDFAGAIIEGRQPTSDGSLARDVVQVIYAAYLSAAEGRRVSLAT